MPRAKILIIEDNSSDVFLLRRALIAMRGENFDLEIAGDGERALQMIDGRNGHREVRPCVILLDLHLPKHDGLEVLRAIRQNPVMSEIRVVVTTNGASPKEVAELRGMGVACRLKPANLREFEQLATDLIAICTGTEVTA
jgi:chemotaxis family two-component system response regulator Rcp1